MNLLKIPESVLTDIFEYTNEKDLLNLMNTCMYFNSLVARSRKLMKKIKFYWINDHETRNIIHHSERKYQNLSLDLKGKYRRSVTKPFKKFASTLENFEISNNLVKSRDFLKILNYLSTENKVKSAKLNYLHFYDSKVADELVTLSSLQELEMNSADCRIIHHFRGAQLTKFTFLISRQCYEHIDACTNFLKTQKSLEFLALNSGVIRDVFKIDVSDIFEFRLKDFEFAVDSVTTTIAENINKFILKQGKNLRSVKMIVEEIKSLHILSIIIKNVSSEIIMMDFENLIFTEDDMRGDFTKMTNLILNSPDVPTAENVFNIKSFRNLIEVEFYEMIHNQALLDAFKDLQKLKKVKFMEPLSFVAAALPHVTDFEFSFTPLKDIVKFLKLNKQIVSLKVSGEHYIFATQLKTILLECKSLKNINFSGCDRIDRACIDIISKFGGDVTKVLLPGHMRLKRNAKRQAETVANIKFSIAE